MKTQWLISFAFALLSFSAAAADPNPCGGSAAGKTLLVAAQGGQFTTIQAALNAAQPGDTVFVKAGKYRGEIQFPRSGKSGACITLRGDKGAEISGGQFGLRIVNQDYISIQTLTVSNIQGGDTPIGISVRGSSSHLELRGNVVHDVHSNSNAHGIAFYGTATQAISDLLVDSNEIYNCTLGQSESMVFNGNVENFQISRNKVHDNDNIGIDIIGYEGNGPQGSDFARNGQIIENQVWNISSARNPTYSERSADGIYVDGGRGILIANNKVTDSDIGVEAASEHSGKTTDGIIIRGNNLSNSFQGDIMMGGYAPNKGNAHAITVEGNTLGGAKGEAEIIIQNNTNGVQIKGNKFSARRINVISDGSNNTNIIVQGNTYAVKPTSSSDLATKDGTFKQLVESK